MYRENDKIIQNNEQYIGSSSILYLNENYISTNKENKIETTNMLKKENFLPVDYQGNETLYSRILVLFLEIKKELKKAPLYII